MCGKAPFRHGFIKSTSLRLSASAAAPKKFGDRETHEKPPFNPKEVVI